MAIAHEPTARPGQGAGRAWLVDQPPNGASKRTLVLLNHEHVLAIFQRCSPNRLGEHHRGEPRRESVKHLELGAPAVFDRIERDVGSLKVGAVVIHKAGGDDVVRHERSRTNPADDHEGEVAVTAGDPANPLQTLDVRDLRSGSQIDHGGAIRKPKSCPEYPSGLGRHREQAVRICSVRHGDDALAVDTVASDQFFAIRVAHRENEVRTRHGMLLKMANVPYYGTSLYGNPGRAAIGDPGRDLNVVRGEDQGQRWRCPPAVCELPGKFNQSDVCPSEPLTQQSRPRQLQAGAAEDRLAKPRAMAPLRGGRSDQARIAVLTV